MTRSELPPRNPRTTLTQSPFRGCFAIQRHSRVDSLRREMDWQFRDRDWRVKSLERFRDYIENLMMYGAMIALCVAFFLFLVVMTAEDMDARREREQPQERSLSSIKPPPGDQASPIFST